MIANGITKEFVKRRSTDRKYASLDDSFRRECFKPASQVEQPLIALGLLEATGILTANGQPFCSATRISQTLILTAQHCFFAKESGAWLLRDRPEAASVLFHPISDLKKSAKLRLQAIKAPAKAGAIPHVEDFTTVEIEGFGEPAPQVAIVMPKVGDQLLIIGLYSYSRSAEWARDVLVSTGGACIVAALSPAGCILQGCQSSPGFSGAALVRVNGTDRLELVGVQVSEARDEGGCQIGNISSRLGNIGSSIAQLQQGGAPVKKTTLYSRQLATCAFLAIGWLSACESAGQSPTETTQSATMPRAMSATLATQTFVAILPDCLAGTSGPKGESILVGLIGGLAPALIDKGFDLVAGAFRQAGSEQTKTIEAGVAPALFYKLDAADNQDPQVYSISRNDQFQCLIVGKGEFGPPDPKRPVKIISSDVANALGLRADPQFYFEGSFELSPDHTAFRLVPRYLLYRENLIANAFSSEREVFLNFSITRPTSDQASKPFAFASLRLSGLRPNDLPVAEFKEKVASTGWMPIPSLDDEALKRIRALDAAKQAITSAKSSLRSDEGRYVQLRDARDRVADLTDKSSPEILNAQKQVRSLERQIARAEALNTINANTKAIASLLDGSPQLVPVNVAVSINEVKDGNAFLTFVASVLETSKPAVTAFAGEQLPASRERRSQQEQEKADRLTLAVIDADSAVATAQAAVDDLPRDATKTQRAQAETQLRRAKHLANLAYRAVGRPEPYPEAYP